MMKPFVDLDLNQEDEQEIVYNRLACTIKDPNSSRSLVACIQDEHKPMFITIKHQFRVVIHCTEKLAATILDQYKDFNFECRTLYDSDLISDKPEAIQNSSTSTMNPSPVRAPTSSNSEPTCSSSSNSDGKAPVKAEKSPEKIAEELADKLRDRLPEFQNEVEKTKNLLPNKFPFKVIESIQEIQQSLKGLYVPATVTIPDEFFFHNFPHFLLCEICAKGQTGKHAPFVYNIDKEKCIRQAKAHWSKHHNPNRKKRKTAAEIAQEQLKLAVDEMSKQFGILHQQQQQQQQLQEKILNSTQSFIPFIPPSQNPFNPQFSQQQQQQQVPPPPQQKQQLMSSPPTSISSTSTSSSQPLSQQGTTFSGSQPLFPFTPSQPQPLEEKQAPSSSDVTFLGSVEPNSAKRMRF